MYTDKELSAMNGLNPPIRGSIVFGSHDEVPDEWVRLNPPIRGSIEQDSALFENYNHKR